ncbi:MAG: hypothetical protein ACI8UO_006029 [Verrucomicrobiales bacterium]|jgi:hypothetical protein
MSEENTEPKGNTEQRSIKRLPIAIHVAVQLLAVFVIFYLVNYLSCRHYDRIDLTRSGKFTLSSVTTNFLSSLDSEVHVVIAFTRDSDKGLLDDIRALADEYRVHSDGHVRVEVVDPARFPNRASELKEKYKVTLDRNMILVANGDRLRTLEDLDLATRAQGDFVVSFNGEIALTAAMVEVTGDRQRKIYIVKGYQRQDYLAEAAAEIRTLANRQNAVVDFIDLSDTGGIPKDADTLIIAAPKSDPTPDELALIQEFWNSERGSIFLALDPDSPTPELHTMLRGLGVVPRDDRILYAGGAAGGSIQTTFNVPALIREDSPITHELRGMAIPLGGRSQSLQLLPSADFVRNKNIHLTPLLVADLKFWGEIDHAGTEKFLRDRDDHHSPLYLGAAIERGAVDDPNLRVATQRMVVVSNPTILSGGQKRQKIRSDFVMSSLNWLLDRPHLQGILPKEPTRYAVVLDDSEKTAITWLVLWILPGLTLLLGIFVWTMRRN